MIYYNSQELSAMLEINISKWKRWVREFLPPDALGGFQSGYARQFTLKEAFRVFLGGILVSSLKYTVPEARRILDDLHSWLKAEGFYALRVPDPNQLHSSFRIYIYPLPSQKFGYTIRSILSAQSENKAAQIERYSAVVLAAARDRIASGEASTARVLGISKLYEYFTTRLTSS